MLPNPLVIGIAGKKRSGKNTVADLLTLLLEKKFAQSFTWAFADSLKKEVADACGVSVDYIEKNKENFRLILQGWGTDFRRQLCGENYWINKLGQRILKLGDRPPSLVIVPDVRFHNEARLITETLRGWLIKVERPQLLTTDSHPSEIALDHYTGFHSTFINSGTIEDLKVQVIKFASSFSSRV